jgi:hypothetical protein
MHKEKLNLQMAQSVHKLKHKISILGLEKSCYLAEEYESNLKNNPLICILILKVF